MALRARRTAARAAKGAIPELPEEVWQLIAFHIPLAHHIALVAPTCKVVSRAVRNVFTNDATVLRTFRPAARGGVPPRPRRTWLKSFKDEEMLESSGRLSYSFARLWSYCLRNCPIFLLMRYSFCS